MTTPPRDQGWRRAALALHAVSAQDRAWLMEQLDAAQRERLQPLLDELTALGTRFDPDDIAALIEPRAARAQPPQPDPWAALTDADLAAALADEPDWMVAALAQAAPAPFAARVAGAAGARAAGMAQLGAPAWPPALRAAVLEALQRKALVAVAAHSPRGLLSAPEGGSLENVAPRRQAWWTVPKRWLR